MKNKEILKWLRDILVIEYKRERESELKLEDVIERFENGN